VSPAEATTLRRHRAQTGVIRGPGEQEVVDVQIAHVDAEIATVDADVVGVGVFMATDDDTLTLSADAQQVAQAAGIDIVAELRAAGFDGALGNVAHVASRGSLRAPMIVAVGLGRQADLSTAVVRRGAAALARAAHRARSVATTLHQIGEEAQPAAQAVVEGLILGVYQYAAYRRETTPSVIAQVSLCGGDAADVEIGIQVGQITAQASCITRDLVNTPPQDKRPPLLADRCVELARAYDVEVRVLDEAALAEGGYGGILGVGQGSSAPPRLVEVRYQPTNPRAHVAVVGKGITFDSGGLSLKPSASMETMKTDMAGAATAFSVVLAAAQLELDIAVTAVLALAENMPSGTATRVSDVLTFKNGVTSEVINTDAEGRLVLADALVHASELGPDVVVDIATLTGAAVVALGDRIGVVIANDDDIARALVQAGEPAGEPLWQLPLAKREYGERVEGTIADLKNVGGRAAGTIFAALFLERFVGDGIRWAHLDIAGTAWTDEAYGEHGKGATGIPTRTLLEWLRQQ
jgi:leucyl aminopeptidase